MTDVISVINGVIDLVSGSPLKLGNISFANYEIPERMPFGGSQKLSVKHLIGGRKIVESLGFEHATPTWTGRFQGGQAMPRARAVAAMCEAGLPVQLSYAGILLTVVIRSFTPSFERFYQIPYTITCEVVENGAKASEDGEGSFLDNTLDDLVGADVLDSLGVGDIIGDVSLGDALGKVQATLSTVGQLTGNATLSKIGSVVGSAQNIAGGIANAANGNIAGAVFGVASGLSGVGLNVERVVNVVSAANTLANSTTVSNLLTRVQGNLAA